MDLTGGADPEPGVFIAADYNGADVFGAASSFWRIEVGARGVPTAVAGTAELPHVFLLAANDFDGDAVTDLLTIHEIESEDELHLWTAAGDGYVERTVAIDVDEAAVGDFLGDGGVQLLFTDSAGRLWLLPTPIADGAEPLAVEGMLTGIDRVLDLGSDGQDEVVSRALGEPPQATVPEIAKATGGLSLPKLGEKWSTSAPTGQGGVSVAVPLPAARGISPALAIGYGTQGGNSPFGWGWRPSLPYFVRASTKAIVREHGRGLPEYDDANESDVFIFSDADGRCRGRGITPSQIGTRQ